MKITEKPLLEVLFDNLLKQAQNNTVFPSQKDMDRVGFEPTTSAYDYRLSLTAADSCVFKNFS